MTPREKSAQVLAYELDCDIYWEPGLPPKNDPSYNRASSNTERAESRRIGLTHDIWVNEGAFPEHEYVNFTQLPAPGQDLHYWDGDDPIILPRPILFFGLMEYLPFLDYPCIQNQWPVISKEMLEVLISVKDFKYNVYPTIINDACEDDPPTVNENFVILQTLEFIDAFDFDKSEYVMDSELIGSVEKASKVILKEPAGGLPPMFRLNVWKWSIYVSAAAKEALEAAGKDRGIRFVPVDENYYWY
jgi:hypothetical protein